MERWLRARPGWVGGALALALLAAMLWINTHLPAIGGRWRDAGRFTYPGVAETWAWTAVLMVAFMALVGVALNGRPVGLFIDNRNRVSLSKFQAGLWTVLVVSALTTIVAARVTRGVPAPLEVQLPAELLAAMAISAASLVATPALLSLKAEGPAPSPQTVAATAEKLNLSPDEVDSAGRVFGRASATRAQWLDMFRGEDVSNAGAPDLSKVQQFLITLVLIGTYSVALYDMFNRGQFLDAVRGPSGTSLPLLSERFVWLLGISHASYLAYKAAPHGPPGPASTGTPGATPPADAVG